MKKCLLTLTFLLAISPLFAQTPSDSTVWKKGGNFNINFSQVSLTNWAGGGQSSIALGGLFNVFANRENAISMWENRLETAFGGVKQENIGEFRKTDDYVILISKYGYKVTENFLVSGLVDFRTQLAYGFTYKRDPTNGTEAITTVSKFMAPGYLLLSPGATYKNGDLFMLTVSPATSKMTFVQDDTLSAAGAFGVDPGKRYRFQAGANLGVRFKRNFRENIQFATNANFFADYESLATVDVNWDALLLFKITKYITSSFGAQMIYDDDVKSKEVFNPDGTLDRKVAGTQFKSAIQIGLTIAF